MSENPFVVPAPPRTYENVKLASNDPAVGIENELLQSNSYYSIVNNYDKVWGIKVNVQLIQRVTVYPYFMFS